eukprot:scaffold4621_cov128-Isochrysis_galbana.AAC.3
MGGTGSGRDSPICPAGFPTSAKCRACRLDGNGTGEAATCVKPDELKGSPRGGPATYTRTLGSV